MYKLYLTGSPRLTREGRMVNCSHKGLALLCYLALEPSQSREQVATLLWEHSAARQNLRVELTKLRLSGLNFPAHTSHLRVTGLDTDTDGLIKRLHLSPISTEVLFVQGKARVGEEVAEAQNFLRLDARIPLIRVELAPV